MPSYYKISLSGSDVSMHVHHLRKIFRIVVAYVFSSFRLFLSYRYILPSFSGIPFLCLFFSFRPLASTLLLPFSLSFT